MSAIQRFLKRRDRPSRPSKLAREESSNILSLPVFRDSECSSEDDEKKINILERRIASAGITDLKREHIVYALQSTHTGGDVDKTFELLLLIQDSIEGVIRPFTTRTKLQGAVNRGGVTCYLDALLFAMFARLDCFEAIVYRSFSDEALRKLSILLRLWVNMLRSGYLITTDITKHLQDALAECGWKDAGRLRQQDTSEAFTFITEKLELPLLTLKIDIFHPGKEDVRDDHKFVNERLLEVAIPEPTDGKTVTLEECLEAYFNNRIEVKRYLQLHNPGSTHSFDSTSKGFAAHVETVEVGSSVSSSPIGSSPRPEEMTPLSSLAASTESTSMLSSPRRNSIIQARFVPDSNGNKNGSSASQGQLHKGTYRKEVMMPAWQFFSLIPWYTDNTQTDDNQVAANFSRKRPILGISLKRYSVSPTGKANRLNTYVDIPTEIGLPHFIQDDNMDADGSIYGKFKLSLQALVCHRGNSVNSGHYIAIVRGTSADVPENPAERTAANPGQYWLRFDDSAPERVTLIDIEKALKDESPYLLFYQILPIDEDAAEANLQNEVPSSASSDEAQSFDATGVSSRLSALWTRSSGNDPADGYVSARPSIEISGPDNTETELPRQTENQQNLAVSDTEDTTHLGDPQAHNGPQTPSNTRSKDEGGIASSFSFSRGGPRSNKSNPASRPGSQVGENRISTTFSRLTERLSRDKGPNDGLCSEADDLAVDNEPTEQTVERLSGEAKEKGARGRSKDRRFKGKSKGKSKSVSRETSRKMMDRECTVM